MEDLKRQLDLFTDYATLRIYWKFYDDNGMSRPARSNDDPRKLKRAYFLFIGKTKSIIEIERNDLNTILEFSAQQIKENQII
jgi:CRISPR/Cas system CSM-associated protein Csm4 (group 5 of RAMP superfamily)